jgi:phosphate uptake regulator
MNTRKVQQVSSGTYTVSIPAAWAREHELEPGTTVHCYTHLDGSLVFRREESNRKELDTVRVKLHEKDPTVSERVLRAAYTAGFSRIELYVADGFTTDQQRSISSVVRGLRGVEIAEESDSEIVVVGLLNTNEILIQGTLQQLQFTVLSITEEVISVLSGKPVDKTEPYERERESYQLSQLVTRSFNRSFSDPKESDQLDKQWFQMFGYYTTARQLSQVADRMLQIAVTVDEVENELRGELATEVCSIARDVRQAIECSSESLLSDNSVKAAHTALDQHDRVIERAGRVDIAGASETPVEAHVLTRVVDNLVRATECCGTMATMALHNTFFERENELKPEPR